MLQESKSKMLIKKDVFKEHIQEVQSKRSLQSVTLSILCESAMFGEYEVTHNKNARVETAKCAATTGADVVCCDLAYLTQIHECISDIYE